MFNKKNNLFIFILLLIFIVLILFINNKVIIENFEEEIHETDSSDFPCKNLYKKQNRAKNNKNQAFNSIQNSLISIQQKKNCIGLDKESTDKNIELLQKKK